MGAYHFCFGLKFVFIGFLPRNRMAVFLARQATHTNCTNFCVSPKNRLTVVMNR